MFAEIHVERGRIRAVFPCASGTIIRTEISTHEFPGAHVFPGFVDNHAHILGLGEYLGYVQLHSSTSEAHAIALMRERIPQDGAWLRARGWNHEHWQGAHLPTRQALDAAFPTTPVIATRVDGHCMWVNEAALWAAGIDPTGHNGLLIDDDMNPVFNALPKYDDQQLRTFILAAAQECVRNGITEVHDMDVSADAARVTRELAESGALHIRVQTFVRAQNNEWDADGLLPAGGQFHRMAGVKLFADGALGSRGALLQAPYSDDASNTGLELLSVSDMRTRVHHAIDAGWNIVAIHAIGDQAVSNVLDVYESVRRRPNGADVLLRIEHAQHVRPEDVQRMAELNVIACVQPSHCISDAYMAEKRLGETRLHWAYRWRSLLDAGILVGAGSDFPIEPANPLEGIAAFVRRVPRSGTSGWQTHECISVDEALYAFTEGAHRTADVEYCRGRVATGYDADLTIVDRDLTSCSPDELSDAEIVATFTAGLCRFSRS